MRQQSTVSNVSLFCSEEFQAEMMARARRRGANAEDALQTANIRAWMIATGDTGHFEEINDIKAYFFRSMRNAQIDAIRKEKRNCSWEEINPVHLSAPSDRQRLEAREMLDLIYQAARNELRGPVREVGLRWIEAFVRGEDPNASKLAELETGYEELTVAEQKKLRALRSLHVNRFKTWCRKRFSDFSAMSR